MEGARVDIFPILFLFSDIDHEMDVRTPGLGVHPLHPVTKVHCHERALYFMSIIFAQLQCLRLPGKVKTYFSFFLQS